jgi:hypothetical protein
MSEIATATKNDKKKSLIYRDDATLNDAEKAAKAKMLADLAARKEARKQALVAVLAFIDSTGSPDLKTKAKLLRPMRAERGSVIADTMQAQLLRLFGVPGDPKVPETNVSACRTPEHLKTALSYVGKSVPGIQAYKVLHKGDTEMARSIVIAIKSGDPSKRVWVSFTPEGGDGFGVYTLVAIGESTPQNWKGYVPVIEEVKASQPSDTAQAAK